MSRHLPEIGSDVTVILPGECLRATVLRIVHEDMLIAEITSQPMMRSHHFRLNDVIQCCRKAAALGGWQWMAEDDRRFIGAMERETEPPPSPTLKPEPKRKPPKTREIAVKKAAKRKAVAKRTRKR